MDMQASLFDQTVDQLVEVMVGEIPEHIKISEQYNSLTSCYVLTKKHVWYLQVSVDYSLESKILLRLDRNKVKPRTINKVFKSSIKKNRRE